MSLEQLVALLAQTAADDAGEMASTGAAPPAAAAPAPNAERGVPPACAAAAELAAVGSSGSVAPAAASGEAERQGAPAQAGATRPAASQEPRAQQLEPPGAAVQRICAAATHAAPSQQQDPAAHRPAAQQGQQAAGAALEPEQQHKPQQQQVGQQLGAPPAPPGMPLGPAAEPARASLKIRLKLPLLAGGARQGGAAPPAAAAHRQGEKGEQQGGQQRQQQVAPAQCYQHFFGVEPKQPGPLVHRYQALLTCVLHANGALRKRLGPAFKHARERPSGAGAGAGWLGGGGWAGGGACAGWPCALGAPPLACRAPARLAPWNPLWLPQVRLCACWRAPRSGRRPAHATWACFGRRSTLGLPPSRLHAPGSTSTGAGAWERRRRGGAGLRVCRCPADGRQATAPSSQIPFHCCRASRPRRLALAPCFPSSAPACQPAPWPCAPSPPPAGGSRTHRTSWPRRAPATPCRSFRPSWRRAWHLGSCGSWAARCRGMPPAGMRPLSAGPHAAAAAAARASSPP